MKKLLVILASSLLLAACGTAPTHPALSQSAPQPTAQGAPRSVALPPLAPTRMYVADWDGNGGYQISPDGKQLMWAARKGLNQGLYVKNLETGRIHSYALAWLGRWAEDSRHILLQVHNGDENSAVMQLDSFEKSLVLKNLTPFSGAKSFLQSTVDGSDDWIGPGKV